MKTKFLRLLIIALISVPNLAGTKDCLELFANIKSVASSEKQLSPAEKKKLLLSDLFSKKDRLTLHELVLVLELAKDHQYAPIQPETISHVLRPIETSKTQEESEEDVILAAKAINANPNDPILQKLVHYNLTKAVVQIERTIDNMYLNDYDGSSDLDLDKIPHQASLPMLSSLWFSSLQHDDIRTAIIGLLYQIVSFTLEPDHVHEKKVGGMDAYGHMVRHEWELINLVAKINETFDKVIIDEHQLTQQFHSFLKTLTNGYFMGEILLNSFHNSYKIFLNNTENITVKALLHFPNNFWIQILSTVAASNIDGRVEDSVDPDNLELAVLPYKGRLNLAELRGKKTAIIETVSEIQDVAYLQTIDADDFFLLRQSVEEIRNKPENLRTQKLQNKFDQLIDLLESDNQQIAERASLHLYSLVYALKNDIKIPEVFYNYSLYNLDPANLD